MENVNVVIHYFWIFKVIFLIMFVGAVYRAVVINKFKSKLCNIVAILLLVFTIVSPIKLQLDTNSTYKNEQRAVQELKVLPPKVTDDSFKDSIKDLKGITKEDLK